MRHAETEPDGHTVRAPRSETRGLVAGPHPLAAEAGAMMLQAGGNAFDAAVASALTLCVVTPHWVGIGGYGGCLTAYLARENRCVCLDFDARAPLAYSDAAMGADAAVGADAAMGADPAAAASAGYLSVTAPAVVAGLSRALERWGAMPWSEVCAPATRLAREGFEVDAGLAAALRSLARNCDAESRAAAFWGGSPPRAGEVYVQRDLAGLLETLCADDPEAFYQGDIPAAVARQVRAHGGLLSAKDFEEVAASEVAPISIGYRGYTIAACPPPSGALTALQALKTLEEFDVPAMDSLGPDYLRLLIEALARAWRDRMALLGDPDFANVPAGELLSGETAQRAAEEIRAGQRWVNDGADSSAGHTIHTVAADREGNLVSLTATHGELFGSNVVIGGLGLALGHGMSRFDWRPGSPNRPAPCKRPQHNMSPIVILRDGQPFAAAGLPGGRRIVSVTPQIAVRLVDFGASPGEAVTAPRIHSEGDEVVVSPGIPRDTVRALRKLGYTVRAEQAVGGIASVAALCADEVSGASGAGSHCVGVAI